MKYVFVFSILCAVFLASCQPAAEPPPRQSAQTNGTDAQISAEVSNAQASLPAPDQIILYRNGKQKSIAADGETAVDLMESIHRLFSNQVGVLSSQQLQYDAIQFPDPIKYLQDRSKEKGSVELIYQTAQTYTFSNTPNRPTIQFSALWIPADQDEWILYQQFGIYSEQILKIADQKSYEEIKNIVEYE